MHEPTIAQAYDRWSATYDTDENATRDLDAAVLRSGVLDVEGRDVIELGCGTGKNTAWMAMRARSVLAMDLSAGMLARARRRVAADHVRFLQHDLRHPWPVADGSADVVAGNLVLEHVQALGGVYAEAARALRRGGRLFLCELHPDRQRRGGQAQFADPHGGGTVLVPAYRHTTAEFVNEGVAAGLRVVHLGEWLEDGAPAVAPPRLLSVLFEKP